MERRNDGDERVVGDDVTRERTARRLLVVRLRVEIERLEAEQPADPRLREARKEPGELTGGGFGRGLTGRRRRCGGCQPGADRDILLYRKTEAWVRRGGARSTMGLESCRCQVEKRNGRHRSARHAAVGRYDDAVPGIVRTVRLATTRRSPRLSEAGGPAHQVCPTDARGLSGTAPDARGG